MSGATTSSRGRCPPRAASWTTPATGLGTKRAVAETRGSRRADGISTCRRPGQLRPIASTGERRSVLLPEVPTLREQGLQDYAVTGWNALFAPARTPHTVVDLLNRHIHDILARPEIRTRLLGLGVEPMPNTPAALAELLRKDIALWASIIERAGIERQ